MWCLWNGEYGEHDLSYVPCIETAIKNQEQQYKNYIGAVVGDFTCIKVEYDWGNRGQRWTLKCNLCGRELYKKNAKDWFKRAHGRSLLCECRKEKIELERKEKANERKAASEAKKSEKAKKEVVTSRYASDEWIGKRNGHLTVIGRDGSMFICRCDCGNEITVKPTFLFTYKNRKDCGMPDCPYSTPLERASRERRKRGFLFEREAEQMLIEKGYNAVKTQDQSDYGVDIIIQEPDGSKIAVQCKKQNSPAGVDAVQEVYAGGRFYDCTKFAVICDQGFSNPAILMARKLGVYLCDGDFDMPSDLDQYAASLLPVFHSNKGNQKLYEIDGERHTLADWAAIYGKPVRKVEKLIKDGCTVETALKTAKSYPYQRYSVRGVEGNLTEICKYFDVLAPTVKYRIDHMGMTLEEAIFTPTKRAAK